MSSENQKEGIQHKLILTGINRFLAGLTQVLSIIVGLSILAYVVGWISARAYYSEFGATWLLSEMSIVSLLGYSWVPLAAFLLFIYLGVTDLLESKTRYKGTIFIIRNGWWVYLILALGTGISTNYNYSKIAYLLSYTSAVVVIMLAAACVEATILWLGKSDNSLNSFLVYMVWCIVFVGFYFAPKQIGITTAKRDLDPRLTELQIVRLHESKDLNLRLLLMSGDRIYAFSIEFEGKYPEIRLLQPSQVRSIQRVTKSKKKSI